MESMKIKTVYLFVDTNLFIQCLPLEELDWSYWKEFYQVNLIVSAPVLREIDGHKKKGNARCGSRARATSKLFRKIMRENKEPRKLVRDKEPCVKLSINVEYTANTALVDKLDYQEPDDKLIGIISEFKRQNPNSDARLLTHDTTPIATARSLGIAVDEIPEDWILPPEKTESDKRITKLESELARYKKAEPQFEIKCIIDSNQETEKLHIELERHTPLKENQVQELIKIIKSSFPIEKEYNNEPINKEYNNGPIDRANSFSGLGIYLVATSGKFVPPTHEEYISYRDEKYPEWLDKCRDYLRNYHNVLWEQRGPIKLCFLARNLGTRPAKNSLIKILAKGNFEIMPPNAKPSKDEDEADEGYVLELPPPPSAPRGRRKLKGMEGMGFLAGLARKYDSFSELNSLLSLDYNPIKISRDPNAFYYKPDRPEKPVHSFFLKCEQWRHAEGEERFECELFFERDSNKVSGAIEIQIHAENLSEPKKLSIPVLIDIIGTSVLNKAERLVSKLISTKRNQDIKAKITRL